MRIVIEDSEEGPAHLMCTALLLVLLAFSLSFVVAFGLRLSD
jgi:hypothetical protein